MSGRLDVIGSKPLLRALGLMGARNSPDCRAAELGVLLLLAASPGRITTRAELVEWLYGDDPEGG